MSPAPLVFGRFELRPAERQLLLDGQPLPVGARAYDVLLALVERRERTVTKHELLDIAWPDMVVEENNIAVQVSTLRRLLGPTVVTTIPGRGYRFTAPADARLAPPPLATAVPAAALTNLPAATTLFGRDADLQALAALLRAHALVSIVGAGGIGKTRLALTAAAAQHDAAFPHGRWWVELAPLNDAALIAGSVAAVLGIVLPARRTPLPALGAALADRQLLLVLDNCEHLIEGVAALVDELRARAPRVRMLVTSQESLKCHDEQVFRLGSLALPADGGSVAAVASAGAVALFVERARAAEPRFRLSADNATAVTDVCRRLDGIALAIELAAARVPLLGVQALRARLDHMFDVLTGAARLKLRRHQTLRAALQWSFGLLSNDERALLRRLGVCAGGFTLELAQHVAADGDIDEWRVIDLLGALTDKSLVITEGDDDAPRYRLLEPTRAFALEQLAAAGESGHWLRRHALAMLSLLTDVEAARWTRRADAGTRIGAELGNLRAALDWASSSAANDDALAYRLLGKGWLVWVVGGAIDEGMQRMLRLWPPPADLPPPVEADFCLGLARCHGESGRDEIVQAARRAVALYRELGDSERLADALMKVAYLGALRDDLPDAQASLDEAGRLVTDAAPLRWQSSLAMTQGSWAWRNGDYAAAAAAFLRQAECDRLQGLHEHIAMANLCGVYLDAGELDRMIEIARRSVDGLRSKQMLHLHGHALMYLAIAMAVRGDDGVLPLAREAVDHMRLWSNTCQPFMAAALHHAHRRDLMRAALVAGHARRALAEQNFKALPIDLRMQRQLRECVEAAHPVAVFEHWLQAGEQLSDAQAIAVAFDAAAIDAWSDEHRHALR